MIEVFLDQLSTEPLAIKDFAFGFFVALALKRGRIEAILDKAFPGEQ